MSRSRYRVTLRAEGPSVPNGEWEGTDTIEADTIGGAFDDDNVFSGMDLPDIAADKDIRHVTVSVTRLGPVARRVPRRRS